jgi:hypothetical protein
MQRHMLCCGVSNAGTALYKTFRDMKQNRFLSSSCISNDLLDVLPLMMEGPVRMYRSLLRIPMILTYFRICWAATDGHKAVAR